MLASVFGPKEANFTLLRRADGTVECSERFHLVVVIDPLLAVKRCGAFIGEKLPSAGHREWNHLSHPWCDWLRKRGWSRLPEAQSNWRRVRHIVQQSIISPRGDQGQGCLFSNALTDGNVGACIGDG